MTKGTQHGKPQHKGTGGSTCNVEPAQQQGYRITLTNGEIIYMKMSTRTQEKRQHKPKRGLVPKPSTETKAEKSEPRITTKKRKREKETEESQDKPERKQKGREKKIENTEDQNKRNSDTQRKKHTYIRKQKPKTCDRQMSGPMDKYLVKLGIIEPSVAAESTPSGENQDKRSISNSIVCNYIKSKCGGNPRGLEGGNF